MASLAATTSTNTFDTIKITDCVIQNESQQDFATSGTSKSGKFQYLVVADSHGHGIKKNYYTFRFANLNWSTFLEEDDWQEQLENICNIPTSSRIGTTFSCVKIFKTHFEITWIGDSSIKIYKKGAGEILEDGRESSLLIWQTKDHDYDNDEDITQLRKVKRNSLPTVSAWTIKNAWDIYALSPTMMLSNKAKNFTHYTGECTNMTRCLGHNGVFSRALGMVTEIVPRESTLEFFKIVAGSDGFWQVMCHEDQEFIVDNFSEVLAEKARSRWEQDWTHDNSMGTLTKNVKIPAHNWDDVAVATWSN